MLLCEAGGLAFDMTGNLIVVTGDGAQWEGWGEKFSLACFSACVIYEHPNLVSTAVYLCHLTGARPVPSTDVGETFDPCRDTTISVTPQGAYRAQLASSLNGKVLKLLASALIRPSNTYPLVRGE